MAGALFYYQYHSWRNRLASRLRRLRQPKYLAGAIVGGLYFYFYLFRGFGTAGRGPLASSALPVSPEMKDLPQTLAALGFMVVLLLAWILPKSRVGLGFSEAEIAFLFPAPVTRRTLIHLKLMGSQPAILFQRRAGDVDQAQSGRRSLRPSRAGLVRGAWRSSASM